MKAVHAFCLTLAMLGLVACVQGPVRRIRPATGIDAARTFEVAKQAMDKAATLAREIQAKVSFEQFKAQVYKEPDELGGKFVVNGDTCLIDEKHLQEFFESQVKKDPGLQPTHLAREIVVHRAGGQDAVWNSTMKRQLTYCVSRSFGNNYSKVVSDMEAASGAWEEAADVNFIHLDAEDESCDASNPNVVFDVRPVNVNGQYLARAFFPNDPRSARNVLIDKSSFDLPANDKLQLVGILRHELGHTLGFRHEHTRPESGACFEDNEWRPLTDYDKLSVMHYPQCNGGGDWSLTLTHLDKNGGACLYGPASGFTVDPTVCTLTTPSAGPCTVQTKTITNESIARGQEKQYGPFPGSPGTSFEVKMQGSGDPDLYVRFGQPATRNAYDCRPFLGSANETCSLDVPAGVTQAHVMVYGYAAGNYSLTITYTSSAP